MKTHTNGLFARGIGLGIPGASNHCRVSLKNMRLCAFIAIALAALISGCSLSRDQAADGLAVSVRKAGGAIEATFTANGSPAITVQNAAVLSLTPSEPGIHLRVTHHGSRIERCGYLDYKSRSPQPTSTLMHDGDQFEARIMIEHVASFYCLAPGAYEVRIGHVQPGMEVWSDVVPIRVTAY